MSAAFVGRTACVCHKQAAVGQNYYLSKRKTRKKYFPKIDENAAKEIEYWQLLQLVYICMWQLLQLVYICMYMLTKELSLTKKIVLI